MFPLADLMVCPVILFYVAETVDTLNRSDVVGKLSFRVSYGLLSPF